jgi:FixJ family two-component response regulator
MNDSRADHSDGKSGDEGPASLIGIVDDDESVRDSISSLLRSVGYKTAVFSSAETFLDSTGMGQTGCLVLDIRMPGLSGLELQSRLAHMKCSIPVIIVSAHSDEKIRAQALGGGAIAFFGKPFNDEALLGAISSTMQSVK